MLRAAGRHGSLWLSALWALSCAPPAPRPPTPTPKSPSGEVVVLCGSAVFEGDVPRCRWPLTEAQQRRRPSTTRLLFSEGRLLRLDEVSGSGAPQGLSRVYEYRSGRVTGWSLESPTGVVVGRDLLAEEGRWVRWVDEQDRPRALAKTHVSGWRRELDARGRVTRSVGVNALGTTAAQGAVVETRAKYDALGHTLELAFFGARGEPVRDPGGAHRVLFSVDAQGLETSRRYLDTAGAPARVDGAHEVRTTRDDVGAPSRTAHFDAQGRPARDERYGAATLVHQRDERGNERALTLLDEQGRPVVGRSGWAIRKRVYDELDAVVETSFFGASGEPVRDSEQGAATVRQLRSERGNVVSELLLDERGEPTLGTAGYHRVDLEYDRRDHATSAIYSDVSGAPVRSRRSFYDGDRLIREEHRDGSGQPLRTAEGYASYEIPYRDDGSEGPKRSFDERGERQTTCHGEAPLPLQRELAERAGSLRSCYERLLRYGPTEEGRLLVELSIDAQGAVSSVRLVLDEVGDGALSQCVVETMRAPYESGAEGDCATVRVPVTFRQER
jgi:hypothetical protein